MLYDTAARRNELFQLKREDITEKGVTKNEVIGKRKKKFKLIYNERTKETFKLLEESRNDDYDTLWLTISGKPAAYESLYNWVIAWRGILEEETGIRKEFNVHSFRHSALENLSDGTHYIARAMNKKFDLKELKLLANHESVETTQGYLRNKDEDKLMEAFGL